MIHLSSLTAAGTFTKTHGIHGELNATLAIEPEYFDEDSCFVCETDGILVPYFIESWRPKGAKGILIQPKDVKSELQAKLFIGKTIYINKERYARYESGLGEDAGYDTDGAYADDLVGFTVTDADAGLLGEVAGIEDSTANMLFIVRTPSDKTLYIPVATEFICNIDMENREIKVSLPTGLIDLN